MSREPKLLDYLPEYLRGVRELREITSTEDPEMSAAYAALDRVLANSFISTADAETVARFERLTGLTPAPGLPLDNRRTRVRARLLQPRGYTRRTLSEIIEAINPAARFTITGGVYTDAGVLTPLVIRTNLTTEAESRELNFLLREIVPAHIVIQATNNPTIETNLPLFYGGGIVSAETHTQKKGVR